MAIKGLPGYTWLYPGKKNDYGVEVVTRTAYNPLTGDKLTVRQAQTVANGGVSFEKRKNPVESIKKKVTYTTQIKQFVATPNKELTKYQQHLKREWNKPRTEVDLARLTGMDAKTASRRIYGTGKAHGVGSSLQFHRGEGVVIRTEGGTEKFLVGIKKAGRPEYFAFYSSQSFDRLINSIGEEDHYQSLVGGDMTIRKVGSDFVYSEDHEVA